MVAINELCTDPLAPALYLVYDTGVDRSLYCMDTEGEVFLYLGEIKDYSVDPAIWEDIFRDLLKNHPSFSRLESLDLWDCLTPPELRIALRERIVAEDVKKALLKTERSLAEMKEILSPDIP